MDIEEKARTMGWVPKEEFRGDPEKHITAEEFVERGENIMPILKERLGKFEERIDSQVQQIEKLNQTVSNVVRMSKTASERAYKKAVRDLQKQQREAAHSGDGEAFDRVAKEIEELEKTQVDEKPSDIHPDYNGWVQKNQWYVEDEQLSEYADFVANKIHQTGGLEGRALYEEVTKRVKKQYPEKFENPKRQTPPPVEGGGGEGGETTKSKKKTYRDLPADAKEVCDRQISQGLWKDRDEYVAEYFAQEEE